VTNVLQGTEATIAQQVGQHLRAYIARKQLPRGAELPSYRQLARELGASFGTVKRGIDELAAEGVVYRQRARGVFVAREPARRSRELRRLAVIIPGSHSAFFHQEFMLDIMRGVTDDKAECPEINFFSMQLDRLVTAATLVERAIDGVILLSVDDESYVRASAGWGAPVIATDYCLRDVPLDFVACDNGAAAQRMTAHLAAQGHRRVLYVALHASSERVNVFGQRLVRISSDVQERQEATVKAMRAANLECRMSPEGMEGEPWTPAAVAEHVLACRHGAERATAVLADDCYAASAILGELTRRGVRVPADISLAAVSSDGGGWRGSMALTCCRFDFVGMGRRAIALLAERCRKPVVGKPRAHRIGFTFVEGASVATVGRRLAG
jgi:DNA-binding LacI/PurR family transcriptional regulator